MKRVLIIGDTHCPAMRMEYPDHLRRIQKEWNCNHTVFIGDVIDWGAINYHEKNPYAPGFVEEVEKARKQVAILYKLFPKADWMIGNHDCLPVRKATTAGLGHGLLRDYADFWGVPGWRTFPRYHQHEIDGVIYAHGDRGKGGQTPAIKNAKEIFQNYVQGHTHTQMGVNWHVNDSFAVWGMNVGCGVDDDTLAMDYAKSYNNRSALGCGVVLEGKHPYIEALMLENKYERRRANS